MTKDRTPYRVASASARAAVSAGRRHLRRRLHRPCAPRSSRRELLDARRLRQTPARLHSIPWFTDPTVRNECRGARSAKRSAPAWRRLLCALLPLLTFLARPSLLPCSYSAHRGFREGHAPPTTIESHSHTQWQRQIFGAMTGFDSKQHRTSESGGLLAHKLGNQCRLLFTPRNRP